MSNDIKSLMNNLLSPDNLQPKIDILASNISGDFKKSKDELEGTLTIKRDGTAAITEIVDKAVKQFLKTFNIPDSAIGSKLTMAIDQISGENQEEGVDFKVSVRDFPEHNRRRNIDFSVTKKLIKLIIKGYPAIQQKNEAIVKFYFNHEEYPGKVLPNGKFDFRELHKFPSVKKNDKLLFIRYPLAGKHGISCTGRHLIVDDPEHLNLTPKEGVIKEDAFDSEKRKVGYFLKASTDGVVILKKSDGLINEIDVNDKINLDKIDFSTGNIGSEFISPVSMEVGEIANEFKVNVDGRIKVTNLNGGIITTNKNAVAENIRSNARVTANKNIKVKNVADSALESFTGTILIENELRDSRLKAPKIHFTCRKGLMLNNIFNTCECNFTGGYYCGVNTIILGKELFQKRLEQITKIEDLEKANTELKTTLDGIKVSLIPELKDISTGIKDNTIMTMFKLFIRSLQSLEFNDAFKVLAELRKSLNVMKIDSIKKSFTGLQEISAKLVAVEDKIQKNKEICRELEEAINRIKFQISGEINPTGTIRFFCGKPSKENEPVFEIKSTNKDKNETINVSGSYTLKNGFVVN